MRKLFGPIILLTTVMAIGVVPFVLFGSPLERQAEEWLDTAISTPGKAALIIGLPLFFVVRAAIRRRRRAKAAKKVVAEE